MIVPSGANAADSNETVSRESILMQLISLPSGVSAGSSTVTRGNYAEALAALLGRSAETSEALTESSFYDVTGHGALAGAVVYLESKSIISGDKNRYFNPEKEIASEDAVTMLVKAMGYKDFAEKNGGYPNGYMKTASDIGLTKNTGIAAGKLLSGEQLINMFYNSLDCNIASISSISGDKIEISKDGETLLSGILNMGYMSGVVRQTPYTSLYEATGCADGTVTVGDMNFYYDDSSIIDYLGYKLDVYYSEDKGERTVKAYRVSRKNEVVEIDADMIDDFDDYTLSYRVEDSDREVTKKLKNTIAVVYNGKFTGSFTKEMMTPDIGRVTLIAENGSDYTAVIIEDYIDYVVASVDNENDTIYTRAAQGEKNVIFDLSENDIDYKICDARGLDIALADIGGNSIISTAASADGEYIKIVVSDNSVSGVVTSITKDDYGNKVWIIGGNEYRVSKSFYQTEPVINSGVKAFCDYKGRIAYYYVSTAKDGWQTGYIIKLYEDDADGYAIKLLRSDNIVCDCILANKVNINGDSFSKSKDAFESSDALFPEGRAKRQVIRYRTNDRDEITKIQTALEPGSTRSPLRATTKASRMYKTSTQSFGFETYLTSATHIFVVPEETTPYQAGTDTNFKVVDTSYFADQSNITVQAYTVGDNMTEAYALAATRDATTTPDSISDYLTPSVVKKISEEVDENGDIVTKMTVQQGNTETEFEVLPVVFEQVMVTGTKKPYEIGTGDAIRYLKNSEGDINFIELIYDADKQSYTRPGSSTINASYNAIYSFVYGRAEYRGSDNASRVFVNTGFETKPEIAYSGNRIIPIEKFGATIVDMSKKKPEITGGDASELVKTADVFGTEKASRIIYNTNAGTPTKVIIYNY